MPMETDPVTGARSGECRLGCWPAPLKDSATCASYKQVGTSWDAKSTRRRTAAGTPRAKRDDWEPPPRPFIPQEVGIDMDQEEFRTVLREILLDELGVRDVPMGDRWVGGEMVLSPGREGTQEKRVPIDNVFRKVILIREKLRVLEQKINNHPKLDDGDRVALQQYLTACYGSLTTFNVLFKDKDDSFTGQGT